MFLDCLLIVHALKPTYAVLIGVALLVLHLIAGVAVLAGHGSAKHKAIWGLVIFLLPAIGVVLYFAFGKSDADRPFLD